MDSFAQSSARAPISLLVAFVDLTRYAAQSRRIPDQELADIVDEYYERVAARVEESGGRVVKFIGDAALIVFPDDAADRAGLALLDLKESVDAWLDGLGWESRLMVKLHAGELIAGPFGGQGDKRFDVIGETVNQAARLPSTGVALSVAAFRKLSPELRKRFKKHTPPITYIRTEDRH